MNGKKGNLMRFICRLAGPVLLAFSLQSCASTGLPKKVEIDPVEKEQFLADKPFELHPIYIKLMEEGERNEVLNLMRLGLDAMQLGYLDDAERAFDGALTGIEQVYADSEQATAARSLWSEEGRKNFKGEPYERVMAYYYRGLLYIWKGDYQNARASFRGGMLQDAFAEEEQHRCDFALMLYLDGWCSRQINDPLKSEEAFSELRQFRQDLQAPEEDHNVLLVIDTGESPRKLSDGVGHYQLKFFRGRQFEEKKVRYKVDDQAGALAYPIEDVYLQAATRGGRQFDHILQGKANFKKNTAVAGAVLSDVATNTMIVSTAFDSGASALQGVGAGIGLISVATQIASANARAEADTRYWDNLPDAVHVASLKLCPGKHRIQVDFLDENGNELEGMSKVLDVDVPDHGSKLVWVRSRVQLIPSNVN